ncbi:hypothetical protein BPOR_0047g00300 [Botrytis porri]|uniref:Nephrocystin 3-like N-terminal domain-containing protein n=1 Tax=Botrytis porri TaxID=87229 RepID=A0A4Z1L2K4_9HELO|nr:hypothetical protein BPOR_0047g00300 [Botrytis porri]
MEMEGQRDIEIEMEMEMEMEIRNGNGNVNEGIEMLMEIEMVIERQCLTWHGKKVCTASSTRDPKDKRLVEFYNKKWILRWSTTSSATYATSSQLEPQPYEQRCLLHTLIVCFVAIIIAEALGIVSSVIAVIDLSVKVASRCSEYYTNVKNARDDIGRLQRKAQGLKAILERVCSICEGLNGVRLQDPQGLRKGVEDCQKQLAQLEAKLELRGTDKLMSRFGKRALKWPFNSKEVDNLIKKLENCKANMSFNLQVDQEYQKLTIIFIGYKFLTSIKKIVLDTLRSVNNAAFDSHDEEYNARCYQGTRSELLWHIYNWARNQSSECVFWLNGMAGTGKSTISRTVAQNFADKGDLGASFFFKRGKGDRGHTGLFFATIVIQLVQKLPSLAPHVQDAIKSDPGISGKALKQQFDALVLQPLKKIQTDSQKLSNIVIVVDALNELN